MNTRFHALTLGVSHGFVDRIEFSSPRRLGG